MAGVVCSLGLLGMGAGSARASVSDVFHSVPGAAGALPNPHPISCTPQPDGVRFCVGSAGTSGGPGSDTRVRSFDGTPLDVNVTLPAAPAAGPDANYPLVIILHGYGGSKKAPDSSEAGWIPSAHEWSKAGYAVVNMSDRGFGDSCGSGASRVSALATVLTGLSPTTIPSDQNAAAYTAAASCQTGWIKLLDLRWEVHDAQFLTGLLVDQGLIDPNRIGATGPSYGGGASLDLAALKDRTVKTDGSIVAWKSPINQTPLHIAAAAPTIPWSDLITSLTPNGRGVDYAIAERDTAQRPAGIEKRSFVSLLYAGGAATGYYAPPHADPDADLTSWFAAINGGEPYESNPLIQPIFDVFQHYKGSYYVLDGAAGASGLRTPEAPAPVLMSNGFTDDLFPVDETVRFANLMREQFPAVPFSLMYFDYGHMRGANKNPDVSRLKDNIVAWMNHYVRGDGADPGQYVQALTQTCPKTTASGGPFTAPSWPALHPGTLLYSSSPAQTVLSIGGNPANGITFDPIAASGACATASAANEPNSASYRLPAATGDGYTLLGAPTVVASMTLTGQFPELAARLLDVAPDGNETLLARGTYRPIADGKPEVFQLHPGAWHFAGGHVPKLELLGRDEPYARASNGPFQLSVSNLIVALPTHETSGNGILTGVALPLPPGQRGAPGVLTTSLASFVAARGRVTCATAKTKAKRKRGGKRNKGRHSRHGRSARAKHHRSQRHANVHRRSSSCTTTKHRQTRKHRAKHRRHARRRARA